MEYVLRPATADDYRYCYCLTKRNMCELFSRHWGGWVASQFRKGYDAADVTMIIVGGRRAGYLALKVAADSIYIDNIQLSSVHRGKGLGTAILRGLLREHAGRRVHLTTFADNPARRLYERLGFVVTETDRATLRMERAG